MNSLSEMTHANIGTDPYVDTITLTASNEFSLNKSRIIREEIGTAQVSEA